MSVTILLALAGALVGCNSSGGPSAPSSCDAQCKSNYVAACAGSCAPGTEFPSAIESAVASALPASPAAGGPSNIVDHYDDATCADWAVTDATNRQIVADYLATEFDDPQPDDDTDTLIKLITTACNAYGSEETPSHIAKVGIASVYGGG